MVNTYSARLGSLVPIEQLYPPLFTLSGARQKPSSPSEKLCARNTCKVAYLFLKMSATNIEMRLRGETKNIRI